MIPNPINYITADPLKSFRKLSKFEQRKIVEAGMKRKPGISVGKVSVENLGSILRLMDGNSVETVDR